MGLGLMAPSEDPNSLGMLDGPVQGAEKRATLLYHAVEVGLVKKVALGITEVLGTKPGRRSQLVRGDARALARPGWCGATNRMGRAPPPSSPLSLPALHLRRYTFHGSDSFSCTSAFEALPGKGEDSMAGLPSTSILMFNRLP